MDAEELSEKIMAEKVAVFGDKVSVSGMDIDTAAEIRDTVDVLIPAEQYDGYIVLDGECIVFRRGRKFSVIAVVEEDRTRWCLNKMREIFGNDGS